MAAPTMSHLICSMGLIGLIFVLPFFYSIVVDNVETDMIIRELQEITDYTSNTVENLYFLANSTNRGNVSLEKELVYLPSHVEESVYVLNIVGDENNTALHLEAYLKNNPSVSVNSWLLPNIKLGEENVIIESSGRTVVVCCMQNESGVYVWLKYV